MGRDREGERARERESTMERRGERLRVRVWGSPPTRALIGQAHAFPCSFSRSGNITCIRCWGLKSRIQDSWVREHDLLEDSDVAGLGCGVRGLEF